jgi:hypothetical protein
MERVLVDWARCFSPASDRHRLAALRMKA